MPRNIKPELGNPNWHEHICLPYRLGPDVLAAFCPRKAEELEDGPEVSDYCCDKCRYNMRIEEDNGDMKLYGSDYVLIPAWGHEDERLI